MTSQRLGRYQLVSQLALGGMAEVWVARAEGPAGFSKEVVIKKVLPHLTREPKFNELFFNEARLAAPLDHPNVVHTFDFGEDQGTWFMVMEYVKGPNLRQVLDRLDERGQRFPINALAYVFEQVCEGLHYAHELKGPDGTPLNLVHRDVSPENVLVSFDGQPKVADFGVARPAAPLGTRTLRGKFPYLSPEQVLGHGLDRRTDVFSLGIMLYEALAGQRPFQGRTDAELLQQVAYARFVPLEQRAPQLPRGLVELVHAALVREPRGRLPGAMEVARRLVPFLDRDFRREQLVAWLNELFPNRRDSGPMLQAPRRGEETTVLSDGAPAFTVEQRPHRPAPAAEPPEEDPNKITLPAAPDELPGDD